MGVPCFYCLLSLFCTTITCHSLNKLLFYGPYMTSQAGHEALGGTGRQTHSTTPPPTLPLVLYAAFEKSLLQASQLGNYYNFPQQT